MLVVSSRTRLNDPATATNPSPSENVQFIDQFFPASGLMKPEFMWQNGFLDRESMVPTDDKVYKTLVVNSFNGTNLMRSSCKMDIK